MRYLLIYLFFFIAFLSFAQPAAMQRKKNPYKWMFGLSWSVIDDDGYAFSKLVDVTGSWHYEYFPSKLMIDRYIRKGWSFEGAGSFNRYNPDRLVNQEMDISGSIISLDFHLKYSFNRFFRRAKWFDPYISSGLGATYRTVGDVALAPTVNVNFGANFWFARKWGVQLQTAGKLALVADIYNSHADYLQHSLGIVYRIDPKKKSSNSFTKQRHQWAHEKQRFKRRNT